VAGVAGALRLAGAFVRLGRPVFLGGGFLLYALGAAVAWALGGQPGDARLYLLGQAAVTCFQLMTHYANDYFDYEADCANATPTRWSGGSRVLPGGELPLVVALVAAVVLAAAGLALSGFIAAGPGQGPLVLPTLLAMGILSWFYSAPPLRLHGSGFGELDVALVVTGLVPLLGFQLQGGTLDQLRPLLLTILPLGLLQLAMLLAIEFPDQKGDQAVGKRTLVVRMGAERAAVLYTVVVAAAFLAFPLASLVGLPPRVAAAGAVVAPLGAWRAWRIRAGAFRDPRQFGTIAFWAVGLLTMTTAATLAAWLTLIRPA
jgi:1,4-dihydroxy-2-naphthoate polyprenyltransferase